MSTGSDFDLEEATAPPASPSSSVDSPVPFRTPGSIATIQMSERLLGSNKTFVPRVATIVRFGTAVCREHGIDGILTDDSDFHRFEALQVQRLE